jgi:hypothetical protein
MINFRGTARHHPIPARRVQAAISSPRCAPHRSALHGKTSKPYLLHPSAHTIFIKPADLRTTILALENAWQRYFLSPPLA